MTDPSTLLQIRRQDSATALESRRWEEYEVTLAPQTTLTRVLLELQANPITREGRAVAPVAFESSCQLDGCGACTLLVNGRVRAACATRLCDVTRKGRPLRLEPLGKLPLIRDLVVDRSVLREASARAGAWLDDVPERRAPSADLAPLSRLDKCTGCAACLEACPEYGPETGYVGARALHDTRVLQTVDPEPRRQLAIEGRGGVMGCGKAQNCVEVCPEGIALFDSILELEHSTTRRMLRAWLRR